MLQVKEVWESEWSLEQIVFLLDNQNYILLICLGIWLGYAFAMKTFWVTVGEAILGRRALRSSLSFRPALCIKCSHFVQ